MHKLSKSITVPVKLDEVFSFFTYAGNLEKITPPELNFVIATKQPFEIKKETLIEYRLKLFGLKFSWKTIISEWDPPNRFVDEQLKGPYRYWQHIHNFYEVNGGTIIEDEVNYKLPFFPFGEIAYPFVRLQIKRIFNYRETVIRQTFISDP